MNSFAIRDIQAGSYFTKPVYLDGKYILTAPEMPVTSEMIRALLDWEFREVLSDGETTSAYTEADSGETESMDPDSLDTASMSDNEKVSKALSFYREFQLYVESVFTRFATKNEISFKEVAEKVKNLCELLKEDRRFLLRVNLPVASEDNYLSSHTVKSTIIAIVIGLYLKLPNHRLIELGIAALLHEIGMTKIPPQLYMTDRPLAPQEKKAILTHPVLSYKILRSQNFPLNICVAALEHHERENGMGYPQKLSGEKISLYAKIISVACSYEALTAPRPYKDAKDGYTGMIDLLKNVGKQYDDTIVRALVFSLSIYPIGLYVLLSNGKKGQVVDVNPENPRYPVVQIFGEKTPDGRNRTLETNQHAIHIVRPLMREEIGTQQD